jgi:hypothetical protein
LASKRNQPGDFNKQPAAGSEREENRAKQQSEHVLHAALPSPFVCAEHTVSCSQADRICVNGSWREKLRQATGGVSCAKEASQRGTRGVQVTK